MSGLVLLVVLSAGLIAGGIALRSLLHPSTNSTAIFMVTGVQFGTAYDTTSGNVTGQAIAFPNTVSQIVAHITWQHQPSGAQCQLKWVAMETGSVVQADQPFITTGRQPGTNSTFKQPAGGWTAGHYELQVYLNGASVGSGSFEIDFAGTGSSFAASNYAVSIHLGTGLEPLTDNVSGDTDTFTTNSPEIATAIGWSPLDTATTCELKWINLDTGAVFADNKLPIQAGSSGAYWHLNLPSGGWKPGHARLEVYLYGTSAGYTDFTITPANQ